LIEGFSHGCLALRTMPGALMSALYRKYQPLGLKMIGFQSAGVATDTTNPENDWESVQDKVRLWEIPYPVA